VIVAAIGGALRIAAPAVRRPSAGSRPSADPPRTRRASQPRTQETGLPSHEQFRITYTVDR